MRSSHLRGGTLLTACAAGQGAIVVVEGEHREDDEWFYSQWFGHLGPRISFFAQNGWEKVTSAVAELRTTLVHRPVFGIIDGDFEDTTVLGVHRLSRYTLENYLLEPDGWFEVLRLVTRGSLPEGWGSPAEVERHVEDAYRACLELAARNRTVYDEHRRHPVGGIQFREHPDALSKQDPRAELTDWETGRDVPRSLCAVFEEHLVRFQAADRSLWQREVTGKAVLKVFLKGLKRVAKNPMSDRDWCSWYVSVQPSPHQDIIDIVESILDQAGT